MKKSAITLAIIALVGWLFWKGKEAEAAPPSPFPTSLPQSQYFPPYSISSNQVQHIYVQITGAYSYHYDVQNPITNQRLESGGSLGTSPSPTAVRAHFDYLVSLPTLSDVDAGGLGAIAAIFGFRG